MNGGIDGIVGVEDNTGFGCKFCACCQVRFRFNLVANKAFTIVGGIISWQEACIYIGGKLTCDWIDGGECPGDLTCGFIQVGSKIDEVTNGVFGINSGAVILEAIGNVDVEVAEAKVAELEGVPVEVGVELLSDSYENGGGSSVGGIFKADGVGEGLVGGEPALGAEACGTDDIVGVAGDDYGDGRVCNWRGWQCR